MRSWVTPSGRLHDVPAGFPETPERLDWAAAACRYAGLVPETPAALDLAALEIADPVDAVHVDGRLARLDEAARPWRARIDTPDCPVSPGTPRAAADAVRTTLFALGEVLTRGDAGIALVRPPGHHATRRMAMGFCYLNNIAIAAVEAKKAGLLRPAILDIDVHHGNGTQEIFYEDGDVFFCSLHEDPLRQYPGTGFPEEQGTGAGLGSTLNLPLPSGSDGATWLGALRNRALPALQHHRPDILLVSAGFDTHQSDPLGGFLLDGPAFRHVGEELGALVKAAGIPTLLVLEGGYDPHCFTEGLRPLLEGWQSRE
jgi:acetoin utilization deacetylase AcuC-like enzyme